LPQGPPKIKSQFNNAPYNKTRRKEGAGRNEPPKEKRSSRPFLSFFLSFCRFLRQTAAAHRKVSDLKMMI
jgi:hypothetical protein